MSVIFYNELMEGARLRGDGMARGRPWHVSKSTFGFGVTLSNPTEEEEDYLGTMDLVAAIPEVALGTAFKGFTVVCGDPHADVSIRYGLRDEVAEYRKVLRALLEP